MMPEKEKPDRNPFSGLSNTAKSREDRKLRRLARKEKSEKVQEKPEKNETVLFNETLYKSFFDAVANDDLKLSDIQVLFAIIKLKQQGIFEFGPYLVKSHCKVSSGSRIKDSFNNLENRKYIEKNDVTGKYRFLDELFTFTVLDSKEK